MKKTVILTICLTLLLAVFAGCGGSANVRDDVDVEAISSAVDAAIGAETITNAPDTYVSTWKIDVSGCSEYVIKINSYGVNIDEYGILKASDASRVSSVKKAAEDYLQHRKDVWMSEYMPEEYPKLDNAQVKTLGNYVMYAILDDADRDAAFVAFETALKK